MNTRNDMNRFRQRTYVFFAVAAAFYAIMVLVTLKELESLSGVAPFDMRPTGYSYEDAQLLLQGLGEAGRHYYLTNQIPLDIVFPAAFALFLTNAFLWCRSILTAGRWIGIGIGLSWLAAAADYLENTGITAMLVLWPKVPGSLVSATSAASIMKAGATTCAIIIMLIVVARTVFYARVTKLH